MILVYVTKNSAGIYLGTVKDKKDFTGEKPVLYSNCPKFGQMR